MKEKFLNWLFYDYCVKTTAELFEIVITLYEKEKIISQTKMIHVPPIGSYITFNDNSNKFLVQEVIISRFGYAARLQGKVV